MAVLFRDLRYAIRMLARSPGFTLIALLTLAVGTGANATVFGFVSALLLRPAQGVADPGSLAAIYTSDFSSGPYGDSSHHDYLSLQAGTSAFSGMAAAQDDAIAVVRVRESVERLRMSSVSGAYFGVLGVSPAIGRLIGPGDTGPGAPPVAVIGYRLWERAFDANPAVLGTPLIVNGRGYTIVGVASQRFEGLDIGRAFEIWTPLVPPPVTPASRTSRGLSVVARLAPGASLREAQSQVSSVAERLARDYPDSNLGTLAAPDKARPMLVLQHTRMPPQFRGMVWTLGGIIMGAAALVLLIACANIASLLLSRAASRDREMAVRLALGAAPRRLVRQLLTESVLLGLAAGALGLLFALWTADLLPSFFPAEQARMLDTSVDMTTVGFVLAVGLASSVLFGLAPALQAATPSALAALRTGTGGLSDGRGRSRIRRTLVMAQVAVSVVLLVSAALLVQSLRNAVNADLGFTTRKAALASVELPDAEFTPAQGLGYYREALARLERLPGVEAAGLVRTLPLGLPSRRGFKIDGYEPRAGEDMELPVNIVSGGYFSAMGIRMLAGRTFDARDSAGDARVVIVNDLLAARFFGGEAIGRAMTDSGGRRLEIVGVARTGTNVSVQEPPVPLVYYPLEQEYASRMTLVARTAGDPLRLVATVRRELTAVDRRVAVFRTIPLSSHIAEALVGDRLTAALVAVCGAMALLLATVGLYGVIAYAVAIRTREIGVRVALGARPAHIVRLVLGEGLLVTSAGIAFGLALAAAAARTLESLLFGVTASDPATYAVVPALLALVALLAALAPAWRALRVQPTTVLRQE